MELNGEAPGWGSDWTPSEQPRLGRALATWVISPFVHCECMFLRFFVRHNKDLDTCVAHSFSKSYYLAAQTPYK